MATLSCTQRIQSPLSDFDLGGCLRRTHTHTHTRCKSSWAAKRSNVRSNSSHVPLLSFLLWPVPKNITTDRPWATAAVASKWGPIKVVQILAGHGTCSRPFVLRPIHRVEHHGQGFLSGVQRHQSRLGPRLAVVAYSITVFPTEVILIQLKLRFEAARLLPNFLRITLYLVHVEHFE